MRLRILICLSALLSPLSPAARAETADDMFHGAAQSYLSNNIPAALGQVENGLKLYPDDVKLKKLEELLKRQNQQQQQQQQKQSSQSQAQKDQNQPQPQPAQKPSGQQKNGSKPEEQPETSQARAAGQMSPQEAKQLLDSQKNNEMMLPVSRKEKSSDQQRPLKDW